MSLWGESFYKHLWVAIVIIFLAEMGRIPCCGRPTLYCQTKTNFSAGKLADLGCLGWPEFSSPIFTTLLGLTRGHGHYSFACPKEETNKIIGHFSLALEFRESAAKGLF